MADFGDLDGISQASLEALDAFLANARHDLSHSLHHENMRLATFSGWTNDAVRPQDLARAGFFFFGGRDTVECVFCSVHIGNWEPGDVPLEEHRRLVPRCPFVNSLPTHNVPSGAGQTGALNFGGPSGDDNLGSGSAGAPSVVINPGYNWEDLGVTPFSPPAVPVYSTVDSRLRSFNNWPTSLAQQPSDLADAGFYYTGVGDHTRCFRCNGGLREWESGDNPWEEHARHFPECQHLLLMKGKDWVKRTNEKFKTPTGNADQAVTDQPAASGEAGAGAEAEAAVAATSDNGTVADENPEVVDTICRVCRSRRIEVVALPCGHLCVCQGCAVPSLTECPVCSKDVAGHVRVYLS